MYAKKKRRRVEKLVEKYAKKRDVDEDQEEQASNFLDCQVSCSFSPLSNIPGVFSVDGLIEGFELLKRYFAYLAPSVVPLLQVHLPADKLSLFDEMNANTSQKITSSEEWNSLKPQLQKLCPIMLPFVAQIVEIDVSSSAKFNEKMIKSEPGCSNNFLNPQTRQQLIQLKVRSKDITVTACAFSQKVLAVGLVNGTVLLYDLKDLVENNSEPSLVQLDAIRRKKAYVHRNKINKIISLEFIKDIFLSNDQDGLIALWDGTNGVVLRKFQTRRTCCYDISLCDQIESTGLFLSAHADGGARLWMMDRTNYLRLLVHDYPVKKVALRNGMAATSTENDHAVRIWDISTGNIFRVLEQMDTDCSALKFVNEQKIWAIAESGIMYLSDIVSTLALANQKLDILPKAGVTSMSVVPQSSLMLLLGTNSSKLFSVYMNCEKPADAMLKVKCLVIDNKILEGCAILATKWCAGEQKISVVFG